VRLRIDCVTGPRRYWAAHVQKSPLYSVSRHLRFILAPLGAMEREGSVGTWETPWHHQAPRLPNDINPTTGDICRLKATRPRTRYCSLRSIAPCASNSLDTNITAAPQSQVPAPSCGGPRLNFLTRWRSVVAAPARPGDFVCPEACREALSRPTVSGSIGARASETFDAFPQCRNEIT
jgi:hypothetical protein